MPIYEYRCNACGIRKEHLQKMTDAPVTQCPDCGSAEYQKQVSAAGFQLKGSGWYATDFKGSAASSATSGSTTSGEGSVGGHSCGTGCGCA